MVFLAQISGWGIFLRKIKRIPIPETLGDLASSLEPLRVFLPEKIALICSYIPNSAEYQNVMGFYYRFSR